MCASLCMCKLYRYLCIYKLTHTDIHIVSNSIVKHSKQIRDIYETSPPNDKGYSKISDNNNN